MRYEYLFLICTLLSFTTISCNNNKDIGGINCGYTGRSFLRPEKIEKYKNCPKSGKKVTFLITHKNIDLSNYDILIDGGFKGYYYYGAYQKEITVYKPADINESYQSELIFRIINKETDSLYFFTSDAGYYIFNTDKPIKVKLLPEDYKYLGLRMCFKLSGCPSELDFY